MTPAPLLRQRLVLESPSLNEDAGGGLSVVWTPLGAHYAAVSPASGAEVERQSQQAQRVTHRVTVRYAPMSGALRPRADQRFRAGERVFDIKAVFERDGRGRHLTCLCEEIADAPGAAS